MTAKKRVISIIGIISLILAITVGLVLSVGATTQNTYDGGNINFTATDVTINASSSIRVGEIPADAIAIGTSEELQDFIKGEGAYGYLTADIELDWEGTGSQQILAQGRTLDGNGHTIKLADADGSTVVGYVKDGFVDPMETIWTNSNIINNAPKRNYGMLVDYNLGTIKNVKFEYDTTAGNTIKNNNTEAAMYSNSVGLVCGTNTQTGRIENCDITVKGKFIYNFNNGKINDQDTRENRFETAWGAIAGRNGGVITNITATYGDFTLDLMTKAQNDYTGSFFSKKGTSAKTMAGGIVGRHTIGTAEVSNIIIVSEENTTVRPIVNSEAVNLGSSEGDHKAARYGEFAAVVCGNSTYSHGYGATADQQSKVDNIIVNLNVDYNKNNSKQTMGDMVSINAVVFCGKSTNVTILRTTDNVPKDSNQHVDYQTDHCNCGVADNGGQHETGYGNLIHTGDHSNVTVGIDADGNQVITIEPKDKVNTMLGEAEFIKYTGKGTVTDGSLEPGIEDTSTYNGTPNNGSTYLYNKEDIRFDKYTFTVRPYQATSSKYWEVTAYSYEIATIANSGEAQYTYNGSDFLANQLSFTTLTNSKSGVANPEGYNARTSGGEALTSGRLPGEYTFTLQEKEAGLSYIDTQNKVVAFVEEQPTVYTFTVNLAQITPIDASMLADNWISNPEANNDFVFQLTGGIEGAFDGYAYVVNGSQPTPVSGDVMQNRVDTNSDGRTYTVYLTSDGVKVTQDYTYTVKIDLTNPTMDIQKYEHPADRYYTHNMITFSATDKASGVASIIMNSYEADGVTIAHSHDLMAEADKVGKDTYSWKFQDTGRKEIVVTDNVGHKSTIELDVKIDTTQPTLDVEVYYYVEELVESGIDTDGNPKYETVQKKVPYNSGEEITSAVYFEANATFGESGGEIRYSLDNGKTWSVYDGVVTVKTVANVKFRAVSNTYDHPEDDVYPYPNRYPLVDNWGDKTVYVNIQLPKVTITLEDLVITGQDKTFDGTTEFFGNISVREGFVEENKINGEVKITAVEYADVNAGTVGLVVSVFCTDDTKIMDNQIVGATGVIEKKSVDVTIDNQVKIYGVGLPVLTYSQTGMVKGFEESISLYVQKPEGYTGSYELLPQTADGAGYVIAIADGTQLVNYTLGTVNEGRLRVTLAPVDRLVYEKGQFTGLDTKNIAERNLEIGFIRSNGNYERLNVEFYARDYYFDSSTNNFVDNGYVKKVDDITKAGAGFFKVVISLPEYDAVGELLTNKYVMDADVTEIMIKVIDASIFDVEEETPPSDKDDDTQTEEAGVNNANGSHVGIYQDGSTNTDNTDVTIESVQQKRDYVAMVSIFCAVAITIAFAIGVGRAIAKKVKK